MMHKKIISSFCLMTCMLMGICGMTQENALWLRYPSISPDGKTIVFGYKGDIYRVDVAGGIAVPLTIHEAHDMMPVWSHDGKFIAFASDRYGNFDVFVMPATGGEPVRLTTASSGDYPYDFSVDDKKVIFGSARQAPASSVRFYSPRLFQNLYSVSVKGGKAILVSAAGMENAHYNHSGDKIVFQDRKGYEDSWRKHQQSSVTRDIWLFTPSANTYERLTEYNVDDREPVFSNDGQSVFFLNEKDGTLNVYKKSLATKTDKQVTTFKTNPVRHLSISNNNTICYTNNGEIYTQPDGGSPKKVAIQVMNDGRAGTTKNLPVNGNVNEFVLSPNGKEIAFVTRGEVFVTSVDGGITKRITNTPQQERMIEWGSDGKTLYYSTERGDSWDIYKATISRSEEPYFYAATVIKEDPVIATDHEEFQPQVSPDGKEIAYLEDRNILKVYNIASKLSRTILPKGNNYSYADGDQYFDWSPDSKWLVVDDAQGYGFRSNAAMIKADGSQTIFPVKSGFGEGNAKFALNGKMLTWTSEKNGRRSLAIQGSREVDVYALFFDQETYDTYMLNKNDYALWKEKSDKEKKDTAQAKKDSLAKKNWQPDLTNLDNRQSRLTINSSSISDYVLSPDASKLYYLAAFEKGYDLWVTEPRTRETKILAKLGGSPSGIEMSKDGKTLFVTNNGSIVKIDEAGVIKPIGISGEMILNPAAERQYIFDHAWRQVKEKFYDPKLHGVDWENYRKIYQRFLPHISNNYDFQELLSEMLGELNGSHTGGRFMASSPTGDQSASLGIIPDETFDGTGIKVDEIIAGGPLDKADKKLKAGNIVEKIDGIELTNNIDWYSLLNRKAGNQTLLSVYDPMSKTRWEETVKPISSAEESVLMYKRWVSKMTAMVDKLSGGRVGYVHVQGMNDGSFREVLDKVMGKNLDKEALIVDTRFNGGGWLHDDLNTFLSGKKYLEFAPQSNRVKGGEPIERWTKPSCVIMSEGNYSDAFIFPYIYKQNGIGKLIGMPVPGTGTAVWWETQIDPSIVFGIPMIATIGKENRPTENLQVEPDIKVELPYNEFLKGEDRQIEAAVKHMLEEINAKK